MARVINLAETEIRLKLTASRETGTPTVLYSGTVGTQGSDAGDGEVVLQPGTLDEPLHYDYSLSVAGTQREHLSSDTLREAHRRASADQPRRCVELNFMIRDPDDDAEVASDYTFWERCDTAPGTVDPTTNS
jgi:hypothetical protein